MKKVTKGILNVGILITVFVLGFLNSCSVVPDRNDSVLDEYVEEFSTYIGTDRQNLSDVTTVFKSTMTEVSTIVGRCYPVTNEVTIDPTYWYERGIGEIQRKSLMFHELVHCHCMEGHDDSMLPDMCPASLMYSKTIQPWCLEEHWDDVYKADLKKKCN